MSKEDERKNIIFVCYSCNKELSRETGDSSSTDYEVGLLECVNEDKDFHERLASGCLPTHDEFSDILNDVNK